MERIVVGLHDIHRLPVKRNGSRHVGGKRVRMRHVMGVKRGQQACQGHQRQHAQGQHGRTVARQQEQGLLPWAGGCGAERRRHDMITPERLETGRGRRHRRLFFKDRPDYTLVW